MKALVWPVLAALALGACGERAGADRAAGSASNTAEILPAEGRVVDDANLLGPAEESALEAKLAAVEREVGPQFAVVTVPSLGGKAIERYGVDLGRRWGLGDKERDDGLLLIVAPAERKVRIEVGSGLEKRVTDPFAAKVIRERILPRFGQGAFGDGISAGSDALIERLRSKASDAEIAKQDMLVP